MSRVKFHGLDSTGLTSKYDSLNKMDHVSTLSSKKIELTSKDDRKNAIIEYDEVNSNLSVFKDDKKCNIVTDDMLTNIKDINKSFKGNIIVKQTDVSSGTYYAYIKFDKHEVPFYQINIPLHRLNTTE